MYTHTHVCIVGLAFSVIWFVIKAYFSTCARAKIWKPRPTSSLIYEARVLELFLGEMNQFWSSRQAKEVVSVHDKLPRASPSYLAGGVGMPCERKHSIEYNLTHPG